MASAILTGNEFPAYLKENRAVPKYDSTKEEKLPHPWWAVDRDSIDAGLKAISTSVANIIGEDPSDDAELQHVLRSAEALCQIPRSDPMRIALIGPQGAGKSLLINALFDCDGLSLTGADGKACTSAIVKYAQYDQHHGKDDQSFVAEVRFHDADKLDDLLEEHARAYCHYQHADEDSDDEDTPQCKALGQDELDRRMKDTAEDVFETLFGSKKSFKKAWSLKDYKSGEFVKICQFKCDEAVADLQASRRVARFTAKDAPTLLKKIKPFMTKVPGETSLWPLVDCISIGFHNHLLQQNVEIIDLPGWGDTNTSRARHADDVKDTVDVEVILADTIRIATDDLVINHARSAALNHGMAMVKLVATKIDQISDNQLAQCSGPGYDQIRERIVMAEDESIQAEEDGDSTKANEAGNYKLYLERKRKERKVKERAKDISYELSGKLQGRNSEDTIQTFHISATDYLAWTRRDKIVFSNQPALTPDDTGIPSLRQFFNFLPAQQNLEDYQMHIFGTIPAFVEKVKRVVDDSERDVGFRKLADEFNCLRHGFIPQLRNQAKAFFKKLVNRCMGQMRLEAKYHKEQIDRLVQGSWMQLRSPTFDKILKCRGMVIAGSSKAKGLEQGCNWNKELAGVLSNSFKKWHTAQIREMGSSSGVLIDALGSFNVRVIKMMDESAANLITVEKAKRKWKKLPQQCQAKLSVLFDTIASKQAVLFRRATMEDNRENSFIATITDKLFEDIFNAEPELKTQAAGKKKKQYVEPKFRFKKRRMQSLFISEDKHFVDTAMRQFQILLDTTISEILEERVTDLNNLLKDFEDNLRGLAPLDYVVSPEGKEIRSELEKLVPQLEDQSRNLRLFFPPEVKKQAELDLVQASKANDYEQDIGYIFEKSSKRKSSAITSSIRIKQEPGSKRVKME